MALHCPFLFLSIGYTAGSIVGEASKYVNSAPAMMFHEKCSLIERSDQYKKRQNVNI